MSLRHELGLQKDPEFDLTLPPGWARNEVSDQQSDAVLRDLRLRLKDAGALDSYNEYATAFRTAFDEMKSSGVFAYFTAADPSESTLVIPASINASIRTSEPGTTLDDLVRSLIRSFGAQPVWGDPRIMVCEREREQVVGGSVLVAHSRIYLTPIPGSKRRRALQLVANFPRATEVPSDAPEIEAMREMFDACVASLRWQKQSS